MSAAINTRAGAVLCRVAFDRLSVGDEIPALSKQINHNQLVRYSGASGDFNPIHTDPEAAKAAGLDGVIAHGLLNMAFLAQMMTDWLGNPLALRQLHCRFSKLVRLGDTVTAKGTIVEKKVENGERIVVCKVWAENQKGEVVLGEGMAVAVLP